jgi:myo-inositol catabolism protein IolC
LPGLQSKENTVNATELFLLAMDHRESLARTVYGVTGSPTAAETERIEAGKELVFAGLTTAMGRGAPAGAGVLVDERYGATVARQARAAGLKLAMPIERSGQEWFTLEYGTLVREEWRRHVDAFDPDYVKVLVRDNPDFDLPQRRRQQDALAVVNAQLHDAGRQLLLELLVPPTPGQTAGLGADFDDALRPHLTEAVISDMQWAGVEPDIWKIEGLDRAEDAERIVAVARQGNRDHVRCVLLGRNADERHLSRWLRVAASVEGFRGFAIGRSIWEQPLAAHIRDELTAAEVVDQIATSYLRYVSAYRQADTTSRWTEMAHPVAGK